MLKLYYFMYADLNYYIFLVNWIFHDYIVTLFIYFLCVEDSYRLFLQYDLTLLPLRDGSLFPPLEPGKLVIKGEVTLCAIWN